MTQLINENIFEWNVALIPVNPDSLYYGGYFQAKMHFPKEYPYKPPSMLYITCTSHSLTRSAFRFKRHVMHPNIYTDGRLCISILHPPGDDAMSGELASERWSPAQRVESVLISILSLLDDPEFSSPANVDAGVMLRKDPEKFKALLRADIELSKRDMPKTFIMPTADTAYKKEVVEEQEFSWSDSEAEEDFSACDSDEDMSNEDVTTDSDRSE